NGVCLTASRPRSHRRAAATPICASPAHDVSGWRVQTAAIRRPELMWPTIRTNGSARGALSLSTRITDDVARAPRHTIIDVLAAVAARVGRDVGRSIPASRDVVSPLSGHRHALFGTRRFVRELVRLCILSARLVTGARAAIEHGGSHDAT